ncbi:protein NO VEIN-like isoform X3 [Haliotis rufescens]|uniref:protein NO VEIN-like isoform X3 n=1 Tax=Haliotis rufescens TaxID=6454 RepID=UPI00201F469A|nr:protein NO VEIN-like isoform X3 [Haliotis rufescens]
MFISRMSRQPEREQLKQAVRDVLRDNPRGIKREHLWNFTAKKLGRSPRASDYGVGKMSQMFPFVQHLYLEFKEGKDIFIKLRPVGADAEVISSDEDDFPSLLSSRVTKAKPSKSTASLSSRDSKGSSRKTPKQSASSDSFLSLDVSGSSWSSEGPSRQEMLDELKDQLVKLLKKKGKVLKLQLWGHFQREYQVTPKGSDYGVNKMADVIQQFTDVIEERRIDGENYLLLRQTRPKVKDTNMTWGQGAAAKSTPAVGRTSQQRTAPAVGRTSQQRTAPAVGRMSQQRTAPGIGRTSQQTVLSSSDDSSDTDSDCVVDERKTFVRSKGKSETDSQHEFDKLAQEIQSARMHRNFVDRVFGGPSTQGMRPPQPLQPLMPAPLQPLKPPALNFFQPVVPAQFQQVTPPQIVGPVVPAQHLSQMGLPAAAVSAVAAAAAHNMSRHPAPHASRSSSRGSDDDSHGRRQGSEPRSHKPGASSRLERREVNVTPVPYSRGPPSKDQIEVVAKDCIAILADANEHVSVERIEKLLCQRFNIRTIRDLGSVRYVEQISAVNEHNRLLCKVNMYVQAFVKARSVCTMFELSECLREFTKDRDDFESLKLGPLQRLPVVYDMFKFPCDEEIPDITTMDMLEHLRDYLSKNNKWMERVEMEPVMTYLMEAYNFNTAYQLGIRIRSLPLAVQMLKKSQRDAAGTRRSVTESFKDNFKKELAAAFQKFQAAILQTGEDGDSEVRGHYLRLRPEIAIMEIFQKFQLLLSIDQPETRPQMKRHRQLESSINSFLLTMRDDQMASALLHLAICIGNTTLEESAMELLAPPSPPSQESASREDNSATRQPPSKATVLDNLKKYIERCLAHGSLSLVHLERIEEKLLEEFAYPDFKMMGFGRFLHFLLTDPTAKAMLDEAGGTVFGSSGRGTENETGFRPQMTDVLEMVQQCRSAGFSQNDKIESALKDQFQLTDVKQLGYGNIGRLITAADKPGKHKSAEHLVLYEAAIAGQTSHRGEVKVGILGHRTREHALACLHNCPLLADLAQWSHWDMVFLPQLGKLKDFLHKYGGVTSLTVEGGTKKVTTDVVAMETQPGKLLKLVSQTSPEKFQEALSHQDVKGTCGHLVSMVMMNKGIENTPTALLANHMKTALFSLHAASQTPGGPPHADVSDPAVMFVLECLVKLPLRLCVALANQIFLEPLGQVVGATKSKMLLLSVCRDDGCSVQQLEKLGCLLGVQEWTVTLINKCQPPLDAVTEVLSAADIKELREQGEELIVESESEEESDSESEADTDDLDSILSDDNQEVQPAAKKEPVGTEEGITAETEEGVTAETEEGVTVETEKGVTVRKDQEAKPGEEADMTEGGGEDRKKGSSDSWEEEEKDKLEEGQRAGDDNDPKLNKYQLIIEQIRREEFGIGVELNEDGQRLMKVQQERLGRSLDRLSRDLYSKDTHFVLELVQNADDNAYPDNILNNENDQCPSVKFRIDSDGVMVQNNENGFREKDIRALCDVGRSTKGKHKFGYIGQKGIGFKSVFRVTDCPEVHSNGFHMKFDVKSGPTGYILPHWVEDGEEQAPDEGWTTRIYLPLKEMMSLQTRSLAARFNDVHPSLLLFLHRLRQITVENLIECNVVTMRRRDLGEGIIEIDHGTKVDRWLVIRKLLDASAISIQAKSGVDVESTEIALAFPLRNKDQKLKVHVLPNKQPVFAFLPLRSYGFRFIIQGDFDVPSSREDVDRDSPWNQWLRNEIHTLFIEALDIFKSHPDFSNMEALAAYLQFVPMEDEILDFFRPVATQILGKLRAKECLPVQTNKKGSVQLKIPSQTVIVRDPLVKEVISPELLQKNLNLYYLHTDVALTLTPALAQSLGVESITVDHLLQIGKSLALSWDSPTIDSTEKVVTVAKWLACLYRSLDEFQENEQVFDRLKTTRIIPLSTGQLVCLAEMTVFLPPVDSTQTSQTLQFGRRDPISELHRDLCMVHSGLMTTSDSEVNSQVQKLLQRVGVKQLSPLDIIHHHILPTLKSEVWQTKSRDILISYLLFIKSQSEQQPSLINMAELKSVARVVTNSGLRRPADEAVHFTPAYGNKIDLQRQLPGYDWVLLDAVYLNQAVSPLDVHRWHDFFLQLGVTDFLNITATDVQLTRESMMDTPWAPLQDMWPDSSTGYNIADFSCKEFTDLVTKNKYPDRHKEQMKTLFEVLDRDWDAKYSKYQNVQVKDGNGQVLREAESSFCINLTSLKWIPGLQLSLEEIPGMGLRMQEQVVTMQPSLLYVQAPKLQQVLGHTVYYLAVTSSPQSSFTKYLRIKTTMETSTVKDMLIEWGKRDEGSDSPRRFRSCLAHLKAVYRYLGDNLGGKDHQDLYHNNPVIFVPQVRDKDGNDQNFIEGVMLARDEVWWTDRSGLFDKYHDLLVDYHSDLAKRYFICHLYQDLADLFTRGARIEMGPCLKDFADLLLLMATVNSPSNKIVFSDALTIFAMIGRKASQVKQEQASMGELPLLKQQVESAMKKLKKQKIFPTKKDIWVSVDDNPMIADNPELEKMFAEEKNVHFLQLDEQRNPGSKRKMKRGRDQPKHDPEEITSFVGLFKIATLSSCVHTEEITEMMAQCPRLQRHCHLTVPHIQAYLYNYDDIYRELVDQRDIVTNLKIISFNQVSKLQVIYTLTNNPEPRVIRPEKCIRTGNQFYFQTSLVDSHTDVNREIAQYFACGDEECLKFLRDFLRDLVQVLDDPEGIKDVLDRHEVEPLPEDEVVWEVPPPIIPEPVRPPSRQVSTNDPREASEDGGAIRSWPPQASATGFDPDTSNTQKKKATERLSDGKMWPPPKPPEYHQQVRDLPSNIKVIRQSEVKQSETSSVGGEDVETTNLKTGETIIIKREQGEGTGVRREVREGQPAGEGVKREISREEGAGSVKRKLSDHEISMEAKRPSPVGATSPHNTSLSEAATDSQGRPSESPSADQGHTTPGSKRRHQHSESEVASSPKKPVFFKPGDPMWSESASELVYEELVPGDDLEMPDALVMEEDRPDMSAIGRWGETLVRHYLLQQMALNKDIVDVHWVNETEESGLPYDFELTCLDEDTSESRTVYIEVKSTLKDEKKHFDISSREVNFAHAQKELYQIYRVFNAGDSQNVKLLRIDNIALKMDQGKLKLFMYI